MFKKYTLLILAIGISATHLNVFSRDIHKEMSDEVEASPVTIFAHGLGADRNHAFAYRRYFCSKNFVTFNFPDAPEGIALNFSFDRGFWFSGCENTGIAQEKEMDALDEVVDSFSTERDIILYGVSRGAAAVINVVGRRAKEGKPIQHIKAIFVESPFARCKDAFPIILKGIPGEWSDGLVQSVYKEYKPAENIPADWAKYIPNNIPVFLIASKQDELVPATSTRNLYEIIRDNGNQNVHYLELEKGPHAKMLWGLDGDKYEEFLTNAYIEIGLA